MSTTAPPGRTEPIELHGGPMDRTIAEIPRDATICVVTTGDAEHQYRRTGETNEFALAIFRFRGGK